MCECVCVCVLYPEAPGLILQGSGRMFLFIRVPRSSSGRLSPRALQWGPRHLWDALEEEQQVAKGGQGRGRQCSDTESPQGPGTALVLGTQPRTRRVSVLKELALCQGRLGNREATGDFKGC